MGRDENSVDAGWCSISAAWRVITCQSLYSGLESVSLRDREDENRFEHTTPPFENCLDFCEEWFLYSANSRPKTFDDFPTKSDAE